MGAIFVLIVFGPRVNDLGSRSRIRVVAMYIAGGQSVRAAWTCIIRSTTDLIRTRNAIIETQNNDAKGIVLNCLMKLLASKVILFIASPSQRGNLSCVRALIIYIMLLRGSAFSRGILRWKSNLKNLHWCTFCVRTHICLTSWRSN
jgi:hypothetical protein